MNTSKNTLISGHRLRQRDRLALRKPVLLATRRAFPLFLIVVFLAAIASGACTEKKVVQEKNIAQPPKNVILIGWDGVPRDHVKDALAKGELPNLQKLSADGAVVAIDALRTTDTKAGWTEVLTGYEPETTGVFSNNRYGPIPEGYTIFERLEKFFGPDNVVTLAVMAKKQNLEADPPRQDGDKSFPGGPFYYTKNSVDVFLNGLNTNDNVGAKALELLEQYQGQRFFGFVHFAETDHKGHSFGENSPQYQEALIAQDAWLGKIVEKLKASNLYGQTLIYVTSDHGFDEGLKTHANAPYVFLATNDRQVARRGNRMDVAATILDRFGLDLAKLDPPLAGHPLTKSYDAPLW